MLEATFISHLDFALWYLFMKGLFFNRKLEKRYFVNKLHKLKYISTKIIFWKKFRHRFRLKASNFDDFKESHIALRRNYIWKKKICLNEEIKQREKWNDFMESKKRKWMDTFFHKFTCTEMIYINKSRSFLRDDIYLVARRRIRFINIFCKADFKQNKFNSIYAKKVNWSLNICGLSSSKVC